MNAEQRREARRKRILENSESRLRKITTLTVGDTAPSGDTVPANDTAPFSDPDGPEKRNPADDSPSHAELPSWTIPKCHATNVTQTSLEDQHTLHNSTVHHETTKPSHQNLFSTINFKCYKIKFSSVTFGHIVLSQIVLAFLYYDLGFLFGHSIVVPFMLTSIPELLTSKEQYESMSSSIFMIVLLMMGFSQDLAKHTSNIFKLVGSITKRFLIYIFCFTCSYVVLKNLHFDVKQNSSIT